MKMLLFVYVFFCLLVSFCISNPTNLTSSEYDALYQLYENTAGDSWKWNYDYESKGYPWNFTNEMRNDPCNTTFPWQGVTCSLDCDANACHVVKLSLSSHNLQGSLPSSIAQFIYLKEFYLDNNLLSGEIPREIGKLSNLTMLFLDNNFLTGSIPLELYSLSHLLLLYLDNNVLTGSLASNISQITLLEDFVVLNNLLTGSIPSEIGLLTRLRGLYLDTNRFTGSIPLEIAHATEIEAINLSNNLFTGSIPSQINSLSMLHGININSNQMTGNIPSNFTQLEFLFDLYFENNLFSGVLPATFNQLARLNRCSLDANILSGSITMSFAPMIALTYISLSQNCFTGLFPVTLLTSLPSIQYIDASNNSFAHSMVIYPTNYVPANDSLLYLDLSNNHLSGSFPFAYIFHFYSLNYLNIANNRFVGSIPELTTVFSSEAQTHQTLQTSLDSTQTLRNSLQIVYLQNNALSGSLPESLFSFGQLKVFVAMMNCFSGSLSSAICLNQDLIQLDLDGLHSSSSCVKRLSAWTGSSSYYLLANVGGTIPSCVFNLQQLVSLHLSGNDFIGSLPASLSYENQSKLSVVNLANNRLTGTIPSYFLNNSHLFNLDLSFNQFKQFGVAIDAIDSFASQFTFSFDNQANHSDFNQTFDPNLSLQVNHLSGEIPKIWKHSPSIDILEGNLFGCDITRNDLPSNDSLHSSYLCGSDVTNVSLYLVLFVSMICLFIGLYLSSFSFQEIQLFMKEIQDFRVKKVINNMFALHHMLLPSNNADNESLNKSFPDVSSELITGLTHESSFIMLFSICQQINQWIRHVFVWLLCIICVVYVNLTWYFGTFLHQYVWILSASYLSGLIPGLIMFFLFVFIMITYLHRWFFIIQTKKFFFFQEIQHYFYSFQRLHDRKIFQHLCWQNMLLFINIFLVLMVNIAYVLALNHGYSPATMTIISILLALFKLLWNELFLFGKIRKWIENKLHISFSNHLILFLCLFNNIIIPYIAEAFVSPNCFYYVISNPPRVRTTYYNLECAPVEVCFQEICLFTVECNTIATLNNLPIVFNHTISSNISTTIASICDTLDKNCSMLFTSQPSFDRISQQPFIETSYLPPYHYNYTCSSSLLSAFGFIFVYRYLMNSMLYPLFVWIMKQLQRNYFTWFEEMRWLFCGWIVNEEQWFDWLLSFLPLLSAFEYQFNDKNKTNNSLSNSDHHNTTNNMINNNNNKNNIDDNIENDNHTFNQHTTINNHNNTNDNSNDSNNDNNHNNTNDSNNDNVIDKSSEAFSPTSSTSLNQQQPQQQPALVFDPLTKTLDYLSHEFTQNIEPSQTFLIYLFLDLTMFLSFGLLFPPLGLLILFSIAMDITSHLDSLNRLVCFLLEKFPSQRSQSNEKDLLHIKQVTGILILLQKETIQANELFAAGFWWSIVIAAWFWAICLYDTLGPSQGSAISLWVLLLMGCGPFLYILCEHFCYYYGYNRILGQNHNLNDHIRNIVTHETGIEFTNPMNTNQDIETLDA